VLVKSAVLFLINFSAMYNLGLLKNKVKEGKNEVSFREEIRNNCPLKHYTGTRFRYSNENELTTKHKACCLEEI